MKSRSKEEQEIASWHRHNPEPGDHDAEGGLVFDTSRCWRHTGESEEHYQKRLEDARRGRGGCVPGNLNDFCN